MGEVLGEPHDGAGRARRASPLLLDGPPAAAARPLPALSSRSRSSRSSSGVGSKREGSGSWSRPERPKSRSNSSEVLKIAAPKLRAARLLDQAALGQASAPPTPRRRRGCGRPPAARPAAGRRRSPASRPGPGSAAASAASRAGAAPPPRWPGSLARAKPPATSRRTTPRLPSARSSRSSSIASATWPSVASVASRQVGDGDRLRREEEQRLDGAGEVAHARHRLADLDRAEGLALLPGRPRPCGRARAGRRR